MCYYAGKKMIEAHRIISNTAHYGFGKKPYAVVKGIVAEGGSVPEPYW